MMNTSVVSEKINILDDIIQVENNINFINELMKRHSWDIKTKRQVEDQIQFIINKKEDKNLNLSIIGEFSSGKSTFINALLRDNLLETDILQGTTVASTVIKYAPFYSFTVNYKDGTQDIFDNKNKIKLSFGKSLKKMFGLLTEEDATKLKLDKLKEYIKKYTSESELSDNIREVVVGHPAEILKNGIVIIDTPGTNSQTRWHEDVTKSAIRDISDVSIVLTVADVPLPESLIQFVKNNLSDVISRCTFVVTKMDLLKEKDRARQMQYINIRAKSEFDMENVVVYPYTPLLVLGEHSAKVKEEIGYNKTDYMDLVSSSYETESSIETKLMEQRILIQAQKIHSVLNEALEQITSKMQVMKTKYENDHKKLLAATKIDLDTFTKKTRQKTIDYYNDESSNTRLSIINQVNASLESSKNSIMNSARNCGNRKEIKNFSKKDFSNCLTSAAQYAVNTSISFPDNLHHHAKDSLELFWNDFKQMYITLHELPYYKANNTETNLYINKKDNSINKDVKLLVNQDISEAATGTIGAGAGATIGTMIMPGVGTVIGGLLGVILGALFGKPFNQFKSEWLMQIENSVDQYFKEVLVNIEKHLDALVLDTRKNVNSKIDECYYTYNNIIDNMIKKDNQEKIKLEQNIANLKNDLHQIHNRQSNMENVKNQLSKMKI